MCYFMYKTQQEHSTASKRRSRDDPQVSYTGRHVIRVREQH